MKFSFFGLIKYSLLGVLGYWVIAMGASVITESTAFQFIGEDILYPVNAIVTFIDGLLAPSNPFPVYLWDKTIPAAFIVVGLLFGALFYGLRLLYKKIKLSL